MDYKRNLAAAALVSGGIFVLSGQEPRSIFTAPQADAGRTAYQSTCALCHTPSLQGRKGDPGEVPALSSLPDNIQNVIKQAGGFVPPLAGPDFLNHWGSRTAADLIQRINEAVGAFPPEGTNIPVPGHAPDPSDPTAVNLAAYFLHASGAKGGTQPLTKTTTVVVNSVVAGR
jgi:cytochrome c